MRSADSSVGVSVIIPCRDHATVLGRCLDSLISQVARAPLEIIVVDSAADPQVKACTEAFPAVRIVRSKEGLLPGPARNLGARQARYPVLAFIDADCTAEPGWLQAVLDRLRDRARLVGGPVMNAPPFHAIRVADNLLQFSDHLPGRPDGPIRHLPSCNLAVARDDFATVGGFITSLGPAGEDVLFTDAVGERWPDSIVFVNAMRVRHQGRATLSAYWCHQDFFGFVRGAQSLHLSPRQRRLGRRAALVPVVVLRRLAYLFGRHRRWNRRGLGEVVLLLPVVLLGLTAWSIGFRRGCRSDAWTSRLATEARDNPSTLSKGSTEGTTR